VGGDLEIDDVLAGQSRHGGTAHVIGGDPGQALPINVMTAAVASAAGSQPGGARPSIGPRVPPPAVPAAGGGGLAGHLP
jgi:hypothetical protein